MIESRIGLLGSPPTKLIDAYNHYYSRSPLLVVDTRYLNFPGRPEDLDELIHRLSRPIKATEYFQPLGAR